MRVYIAGALSGGPGGRTSAKVVTDYIQNINRMALVASIVRRMGHCPYIPALDIILGIVNGDWDEEDYRGIGMSFLEVCDAVLVISDSTGVQREVTRARELGVPIYYELNDLEANIDKDALDQFIEDAETYCRENGWKEPS